MSLPTKASEKQRRSDVSCTDACCCPAGAGLRSVLRRTRDGQHSLES